MSRCPLGTVVFGGGAAEDAFPLLKNPLKESKFFFRSGEGLASPAAQVLLALPVASLPRLGSAAGAAAAREGLGGGGGAMCSPLPSR